MCFRGPQTRPDSKPGHFWHDSALRLTTFGWQRAEDPYIPCYSDAASASKVWADVYRGVQLSWTPRYTSAQTLEALAASL